MLRRTIETTHDTGQLAQALFAQNPEVRRSEGLPCSGGIRVESPTLNLSQQIVTMKNGLTIPNTGPLHAYRKRFRQ